MPFLLLLLPIPRTEIILLGILGLHGFGLFSLVFPYQGEDAVRTLEKMGRNSEFFGIAQVIPSRLIVTASPEQCDAMVIDEPMLEML